MSKKKGPNGPFSSHFGLRAFLGSLDTSGLPGELTQIVDPGATDFAATGHNDLRDGGAIDRKRALNADARANLADGEGFPDTMTAALDDNAFIDLDAFFLVLDDADRHRDGVTAGELRNVLLKLTGSDFFNEFGVHCFILLSFVFSSGSFSVTWTADPA